MHTEDVSVRYRDLDLWPTADVVAALLEQQLAAVAVVRAAAPALAAAVEAAIAALAGGSGRLIYVGAGTSGRLAVQDGVELLPTFGWPETRLVTLMAGGSQALLRSVEAAEDDAAAVRRQLQDLVIGPGDVVIAVAASGTTPFAVAAAAAARAAGAVAIGLANNAPAPLLDAATHAIALPTGAEVVAGSTRLAAGTAQKAALNALSTAIMVGLGHTYGNLMVDVAARNAKLEERRVAMLQRIVAVDRAAALAALQAAGGHVKTAALLARGDDLTTARTRLAHKGGRLRAALAELG
ncbi:MAG: N-acetylmuramic acid 6-phosphate etherase [Geminicoccaceae bacterium]|nr:MAG: N-acetylmuramic acid 6-phosphate etherase [Geminicoccaceae bacterium]